MDKRITESRNLDKILKRWLHMCTQQTYRQQNHGIEESWRDWQDDDNAAVEQPQKQNLAGSDRSGCRNTLIANISIRLYKYFDRKYFDQFAEILWSQIFQSGCTNISIKLHKYFDHLVLLIKQGPCRVGSKVGKILILFALETYLSLKFRAKPKRTFSHFNPSKYIGQSRTFSQQETTTRATTECEACSMNNVYHISPLIRDIYHWVTNSCS